MALPSETVREQDVTITNAQQANFEVNPVDPSGVKFSTWVSSTPNLHIETPFDGSQGLTCIATPNPGFVGEADIVCDIWYNNDFTSRRWWHVFVTAAPASETPPAQTKLNPAVTVSKKKHKYAV